MDLAVLYPRSVLRLPSSCFSPHKSRMGGGIYSIKDGLVVSVSRNNVPRWDFFTLSIRSCEDKQNRTPRANPERDETPRINEHENSNSSNGKPPKSPNQQEVIALIRRIRSSISKKKPTYAKKRKVNEPYKKSRTWAQQPDPSRKQVKDKRASRADQQTMTKRHTIHQDKKGSHQISKAHTNQSRPPFSSPPRVKTDHTVQKDAEESRQISKAEKNLSRPPISFTRKSPIPSPSPPRVKTTQTNAKSSDSTVKNKELELQRLEDMTLKELKELARTRGIKGYSKLRKSELMELLRS